MRSPVSDAGQNGLRRFVDCAILEGLKNCQEMYRLSTHLLDANRNKELNVQSWCKDTVRAEIESVGDTPRGRAATTVQGLAS